MSDRWSRLAPLSGVVFVVLVVASIVLSPKFPDNTASGTTVLSFYKAHAAQTQIADLLTAVAIFVAPTLLAATLIAFRRKTPQ